MTLEEELNWYKTHERVTGCRNTVAMEQAGFILLGKEHVTAIINVDDFNYYNDTYSHAYGDMILGKIGEYLREIFGDECVFGLGSDEFEIFLPGNEEHFLKLYRELEDRLRYSCIVDGRRISLTLSTGYAYGVTNSVDEELNMSHMAANNMYEAKREGKMRCLGSPYTETSLIRSSKYSGKIYRNDELDPLTGLLNMVAFRERARKMLRREEISDRESVVVFFNIVNFKRFNEKYGYECGDELLKGFAEDLKDFFEGDLISRFFEDHFCVITGRDMVEDTMHLLRECLRRPLKNSILNMNAGIYVLKGNERIIEAVDRARIAAESIPKHSEECYRFYDEIMDRMLSRQKYIIENLDKALQDGDLRVYLQPVIRSMTGELCGAEALARWVDPEYGVLPPQAFISILEENRLIHKLDSHIVNEVCRVYRERADKGLKNVPVSFNLSRLDFELCDMVKVVEDATERYHVPREMVHVEITESILNDDEQCIRTGTARFHKLGYQVWMDDFGSGYSTLNVLKEYDFDELKIDMKFLSSFSEKSKKIITSIIDMAKKLGIQTLAEGVETQEQAEFLRSVGCEKLQGYYFGRPEPVEELLAGMESGRFTRESARLASYHDDIGKINLIDEHSMAIVEYIPDGARVLYHNEAFNRTLDSLGSSIDIAEARINDDNFPLVRIFNTFIQKLAVTKTAERINFVDNGRNCTMLGRIVAHKGERFAIQVFLVNLSMAEDVYQEQEADNEIYTTKYSI